MAEKLARTKFVSNKHKKANSKSAKPTNNKVR